MCLSRVARSAALVVAIFVVEPAVADQGILARLWEDPRPVASRDLYWGAGSQARAPRPPFTFVEDKGGGTQPKVTVTDGAGVTWDVKFGEEVHAEVAASRLVWALGYFVDELYVVKDGTIGGAADSGVGNEHLGENGVFRAARFERRQEHQKLADRGWSFAANPFVGSRELSGLKVLMTLLANWDIEGERNNRVVDVTAPGAELHRRYFIGDLGATFGRMGTRLTKKSKWRLDDYRREPFIERVDADEIDLEFEGLETDMDEVPLDHARWFADLLGELTPAQVRQAFEAAGATPEEVSGFSEVVLGRIAALRQAVGSTTAAGPVRR